MDSTFAVDRQRVAVVADDDPAVRMLIRETLRAYGWHVFAASDGDKAVQLVSSLRPTGVILDIMMPGCDGLTALGRYRETDAGRRTVTVLCTAKADSADVAVGLRAGADDYVVKPFDPEELVRRLEQAVADRGWRLPERTELPLAPGTDPGGDWEVTIT